MFDPGYWRTRDALVPTAQGRGTAWFIRLDGDEWVLRHYSRGGWAGKFLRDTYLWAGEPRVRAFAELRLTQALHERGLPVPVPMAAAYRRSGLTYRCDLITRRIAGAVALSARLAAGPLGIVRWREIGTVIARFHRAGVDHADLNAHNILLRDGVADGEGVSLIDFDRGRLRTEGPWRQSNLARLQRSLVKIQGRLAVDRFDARCWDAILSGYEA